MKSPSALRSPFCLAGRELPHSVIELSNPSLPDYGVDESYQLSDQRHWTLKCPACGEWTALDKEFPTKIGQEVRIILQRPDDTFYRACLAFWSPSDRLSKLSERQTVPVSPMFVSP